MEHFAQQRGAKPGERFLERRPILDLGPSEREAHPCSPLFDHRREDALLAAEEGVKLSPPCR
jgi:hypothetical protein